MKLKKCDNRKRGGMPFLSVGEKTVKWTIYLPESIFNYAKENGGGKFIRKLILADKQKVNKENL